MYSTFKVTFSPKKFDIMVANSFVYKACKILYLMDEGENSNTYLYIYIILFSA